MNSIRNFRDLGNIQSKYGRIKPKTLLRGGPLNDVSHNDKERLQNDYHLLSIIDFRSEHEILSEPNDLFEGVKNYHIKIIPDFNEDDLQNFNQEGSFMMELYKIFVNHKESRVSYKRFIETVAKNVQNGAVYFHCTAGKDRTGFGAAILLKLLGVSDEEIFKNYLETNTNITKDKEALIASFDDFNPFEELDEDALYDIFGVKEAYLDSKK